MPITIATGLMKYRNQDGTYEDINAVSYESGVVTHICSSSEYDAVTRIPTVLNPEGNVFYLVPAEDGSSPDMFVEWIYANNAWERFGNVTIEIPVQDVQVNGTSIVNNGVANVPIAGSSALGAVKINYSGLKIDSSGLLQVAAASDAEVKAATASYAPIVPSRQHASAFFGLAKAAGDSTQASSANAVGTYTTEAKAAIRTMLGTSSSDDLATKVDKSAIDNAGITNYTYTTKYNGQFSVTTAASQDYINPYARASVTGNLTKEHLHRITVNDVQYILPIELWFDEIGQQSAHGHDMRVYEYAGNLSLYKSDISGIPIKNQNVPFVIITNRDQSGSVDVITETAGTYTITVEEIVPTQKELPSSLIYGSSYYPVNVKSGILDLNSFSIGLNEFPSNSKGSYAIGVGNKIANNFDFAAGSMNYVSGAISSAIGRDNTVSGDYACAVGNATTSSGNSAFSCGEETTASGRASHSEGGSSVASGNWAHAEGSNTTASLDAAHSEGINSIAAGPYSHVEGNGTKTTSSAISAHAEGYKTTASAKYSHAEGSNTTSSANGSHAEGAQTIASGAYSHAEGAATQSAGLQSHSEGLYSIAKDHYSHAEGSNTIAGYSSHVQGRFNVSDTHSDLPEWVANTMYAAGDKVKRTVDNVVTGYQCITGNSDSSFDSSKWSSDPLLNYADIVGNGTADNARSNAYALTWTGDGKYAGHVYVGSNANSSGGTMLPEDVQVNGTSIVQNGVANVPVASTSAFGAVKIGDGYGIYVDSTYKNLRISKSDDNMIKAGTHSFRPIVPDSQHVAAFYGLAKAAGDSTQSASENAVGTYTADAKAAIQTMLGVPGDVQVNGTSVVSNGVANIPICSSSTFGVVKIDANSFGVKINDSGRLYIDTPSALEMKVGTQAYKPITPATQNTSVFYGLAKAAGDSTQSASANAVGVYTDAAKSAIHDMLNAPETVSGTTPAITGKSGIRYICGEVATLSITPPVSGDVEVIFESGSTAAVLTVPNTVKFPSWFDATDLEANTIYDIIITDATYGAVMSWEA